jgi:hypothetical protein
MQLLLRDLIRPHGSIGSLKRLETKLFNICLTSSIIHNRLIGGMFGFYLRRISVMA